MMSEFLIGLMFTASVGTENETGFADACQAVNLGCGESFQAAVASKTEFNGIGELRNHIRNRAGVCSKTNRPAQGRNQWLGILEFLDGPADTKVRRHGQCGLWLLR
jgi:hypothetical protein